MVMLMSSDGAEVEFPDAIIDESGTLADLLESGFELSEAIPLANVDEDTLMLLRNWCDVVSMGTKPPVEQKSEERRGHKAPNAERKLSQAESEYFESLLKVDQWALLNAANYLAIQDLLDAGIVFLSDIVVKIDSASEILSNLK